MASTTCPLPEVGEALDPYIKSRAEVASIRRDLQSLLQAQLQRDGIPLSSINVTTPTISQPGIPPASIIGIRKAYWKALLAHQVAQAKHDALRADLDKLKHQRVNGVNAESQPSTNIGEDYIPLLRLREKQRKLKSIESAYDSIATAGINLSTATLDDVVKKQIGETPVQPNTQPTTSRNSEAETKILELKKALISTKRRVEERRRNVASGEMNGTDSASPQMEIAGLQDALQELTGWMETQLTIIANAEATAQPDESPAKDGATDDINKPDVDIEVLYQNYLEARERLVRNVNDPPLTSSDHGEHTSGETSISRDGGLPVKSPAEILLPYIPILAAGKQEEQALMQQSAYVRRHISSAETATERLLRRLADESHLVQPGSNGGDDWATAAKEASNATTTYVKTRVEAGELSVDSAEQALESIKSMPASLDRLLSAT